MTRTPPPSSVLQPTDYNVVANAFLKLGSAPGLGEEAENLAELLKSHETAKVFSNKTREFAIKMVNAALDHGKLSSLQRLWLRFMLEQALMVQSPINVYGSCVRCGAKHGLVTATNDKFCISCVAALAG